MNHYKTLWTMLGLHFIAMFFLMYSMIYSANELYLNLNQVYMAALMTAPMVLSMIWLMPSMYPDKKMNFSFIGGAVIALALSFWFIRAQTAIGDKQFLRSMIPHHSGAVLMCNEASISDSEIRQLCQQIIQSQTQEIKQMERMLQRL